MKLNRLCLMILVIILFAGLADSAMALPQQQAAKKEYVCPPCGCSRDNHVFDRPGACTACGMDLVEKGSQAARPATQAPAIDRKKAAILIFNGVQIIDYTGPYEVFGQAGFETFTVAPGPDQVTTAMGMQVTARYTIDNSPKADVLIVPGGGAGVAYNDERVIRWVQEKSKEVEFVLSVCNGAYIIAKAGLLDGLTATTFYDLINDFREFSPKTRVVRDRRYVDNGKIITTAGISSGIDGSLYVVSKMMGKARAQMTALNMEYNWQPDSGYARASFADLHIRKIFGRNLNLSLPEGSQLKVIATEGSNQTWEVRWQVEGQASALDILKALDDRLTTGEWARQGPARSDGRQSNWRFKDDDGNTWSGTASVQPAGEKTFDMRLRIDRTGSSAAKPAVRSTATAETIVIRDAWIQEMPPSQKLTAAFMIIENHSPKETALLGARADIAGAVELHRMETENEMMRMRKLDRIQIPTGKTELTGQLHIMLIDLKSPAQAGDQVQLSLEFENSVVKTLLVPVRKRSGL